MIPPDTSTSGDSPPDHSPSGDDITTTTSSPGSSEQLLCPVCWTSFARVRRQRFCSDNCRKTAWARTHRAPAAPAAPVPPRGRRREATVYACPSCDMRFYGQQWCPDCNQPCTRVGLGGLCPHCQEPVALTDLLDTPQNTPEHPARG
jgi:predicted amidophosphoribosyltransferase